MRTREEHLRWCKDRALEYARHGDLQNAITSMASDMSKHPECGVHASLLVLGGMYAAGFDRASVIRWIEGFR